MEMEEKDNNKKTSSHPASGSGTVNITHSGGDVTPTSQGGGNYLPTTGVQTTVSSSSGAGNTASGGDMLTTDMENLSLEPGAGTSHRDSGYGTSVSSLATPSFYIQGENSAEIGDTTFDFPLLEETQQEGDSVRDSDSDTECGEHYPVSDVEEENNGSATKTQSPSRSPKQSSPPIAIPGSSGAATEPVVVRRRTHRAQRHAMHTPPRGYTISHNRFSTGSMPTMLLDAQRFVMEDRREMSTQTPSPHCQLMEQAIEWQRHGLRETHQQIQARGQAVTRLRTDSESGAALVDVEDAEVSDRGQYPVRDRSYSTPCLPRKHMERLYGIELRRIADEFQAVSQGMCDLYHHPDGRSGQDHVRQSASFPGASRQQPGMWQHVIQFLSPHTWMRNRDRQQHRDPPPTVIEDVEPD